MSSSSSICTFLWFESGLDSALEFYKTVFGSDLVVHSEQKMGSSLFSIEYSILGHRFTGMCSPGGPKFSDAISLQLKVDGQEEVDRIWDALALEGEVKKCGWIRDKFGVAWQIIPHQMSEFVGHPDSNIAQQNWAILRGMAKISLCDFVK